MVYSVDWKYYSCLCVPLTTPMSAQCLCLSANTQHDVSPASAGGRMMLRWGVSANTSAAAKSKYFHFQHGSATHTHQCHCVCMTNRFFGSCASRLICIWWPLRSRCWNACFTFLHQSLLGCSLTTVSVECEMSKERNWAGIHVKNRGVKGLGAEGS